MSSRAVAGGEVGQNGEFYKGGTFLPNTCLPKRSSSSRRKAKVRRVLVEPGVLVDLPADCTHSLFDLHREFVHVVKGVAVVFPRPDEAVAAYVDKDVAQGRAKLAQVAQAYNDGKRWICRDGKII